MKHKFISRGRHIEVEEIEGIIAEKLGDGEPELAEGDEEDEAALRSDDWAAFRRAGWAFIRQDDPFGPAIEEALPGAVTRTRARVFRDANGRLMLGSDRLSVRLRPGFSETEAREFLASAGLTILHKLGFAPNLFEVEVSPGTHFLEAAEALFSQPEVEYAEPQFTEYIPLRFRPSDPEYSLQWHLNNTGQDGGRTGADLEMEEAWTITRGAGTRIAVVDTGFDFDHPDLTAALTPACGYFVPDAGGSARFVKGLNEMPKRKHGTRCAGMAAARADNGNGGCGVAHESALTIIACLGDQLGNQLTLARAIAYAADPRLEDPDADPADAADVITCSLGPFKTPWRMTPELQNAIDFATQNGRQGKGTPIFWATDNANVPVAQDEVCSYAKTIAVGRSTNRDREDGSAFGPGLDFLAPGVNVLTTEGGGGTQKFTGTSLAAPAAAGVGALVLAHNPGLTWREVRDILRRTCEKVGCGVYDCRGHNENYGFGRINAAMALCQAVCCR